MDKFYLIFLGIITTICIIVIAFCLVMYAIDDGMYDNYDYDGNDRV